MKAAIATDGNQVAAHFGRCQAYTLVELAGGKVKEIIRKNNPGHLPGAIPQYLHGLGVERIICGGLGNRAVELFQSLGIEVSAGVEGNVDGIIRQLADGTLTGGESSCTPGAGRGTGMEKVGCDHDSHAEGGE